MRRWAKKWLTMNVDCSWSVPATNVKANVISRANQIDRSTNQIPTIRTPSGVRYYTEDIPPERVQKSTYVHTSILFIIMGASSSKPMSPILEREKFDDNLIETRTAQMANLTINDTGSNPRKTLDTSLFSKWEDRLLSDPKNRLALSAFTQGDMLNLIRKREAMINDGLQLFSDKIQVEGRPITNQKSSGRCWLFASTNVMRVGVMNK